MGPMLYNSASDGPAMVLSPPRDHSLGQFPSRPMPDAASGSLQSCAAGPGAFSLNGHQQNSFKLGANHTSRKSAASSGYANPSRKRTRSDFTDENEDSYSAPVYGQGMMRLNPRTGMVLEKAVAAAPPVSAASPMPDTSALRSCKSQRLTSSAPSLDDISSPRQRLQSTTNEERQCRALNRSSNSSPNEPQIDNFTHLLGISWQRIGHDGDMAPAVRGWEKYIDNHYARHLQGAQILLKNRGLNVYFVAARSLTQATSSASDAGTSSFYLFSDDLSQGQLVGSNWESCLQNLRSVPVVFEGTEVLKAAEKTSDPLVKSQAIRVNGIACHGIPAASSAGGVGFGNGNLNEGLGMSTGMDIDM